MTINSQLSTTEPKRQKLKLSKQLEQEQNHRNGHQFGGFSAERRRIGKKVQGIRSINGKYKIDREILRTYRRWRSQGTYM